MEHDDYEPLAAMILPHLGAKFCDLPDDVRERVKLKFVDGWDGWTPEQRTEMARQHDRQYDPAMEKENAYWFNLESDIEEVEREITELNLMSHHGIPSEARTKKEDLILLRAKLFDLERWRGLPPFARDMYRQDEQSQPEPLKEPAAQASEPGWTLKKPERYQGYGKPLYDVMKAAHAAGSSRPTALDVLGAFAKNKPLGILSVTSSTMDYENGKGEKVTADLDAIRKAIGRLVIE